MMIKLIRTILFILIATFFSVELAFTQTLTLKNVTVINDLGHVRINWDYNGAVNLLLFRDESVGDGLYLRTTISNLSQKSYIDITAEAHRRPRLYRITMASPFEFTQTQIVSTIYLTYNYDSCLQQINLQWKELKKDVSNEWVVNKFEILKKENGVLVTFPVNASQWNYTFNNIKENTNYEFIIRTHWNNQDSTSLSNPIRKFTLMPLSPDNIKTVSASANGTDTKLKFEIASNSELDTYTILKSDSYFGPFSELETVKTKDYTILTTDPNSDPESKISYYKMISVNQCGNQTTHSDVMNNIVLQIENNEFTNTLNWNSFKADNWVSAKYEVYRAAGNESPQLIRSLNNFNTISDNLESLQGEGLSGQFCYFIRAFEQGSTEYSQSNTVCIFLTPKIFIPTAFTPNGDNVNDEFKPKFTFLPLDYLLRIYNRWGNIVFETNNPENGWKGNESNGKATPTGTYIYYLKIKTPNGKTIEERGNITVFYP